jgi:hypothetical protein
MHMHTHMHMCMHMCMHCAHAHPPHTSSHTSSHASSTSHPMTTLCPSPQIKYSNVTPYSTPHRTLRTTSSALMHP